jgi:hypothetical protein
VNGLAILLTPRKFALLTKAVVPRHGEAGEEQRDPATLLMTLGSSMSDGEKPDA